MERRRLLLGFSATILALIQWTPHARADGGTVRASVRHERWQISVFTSPPSPRAGPIDVSVLVQDIATGQPVSRVRIVVRAEHRSGTVRAVEQLATREAAENQLLQSALLELPEPGIWDIRVRVEDERGTNAELGFDLELSEPLPNWLSLAGWIAWPAGVVILFVMHQWLVRRKRRGAMSSAHKSK